MSNIIDYQAYVNDTKLSDNSVFATKLVQVINNLHSEDVDISRLLCGAIGTVSESAELLQEAISPMSPKFVDELGDVYFYLNVSATALGVTFNEYTTDCFTSDIINDSLSELQLVQNICIKTGNYLDIVKKVLFQGKKIDIKVHTKLIDLIYEIYFEFYCLTKKIDITIPYVILVNRNKLDCRYKDKFSVMESETRP